MRKSVLQLFLVFVLAPSLSFGQYDASPQQIDSLLEELASTPVDSSRTPILVNLWRAHINRDIDKAFGYADQLIALGKQLDNVPIQHTGYQRMGIAYSYIDDYPSSNTYYRKAMELSEKYQRYNSTAAMQINIAINHSIMNQQDSTLMYANKAIENFAKDNDSTGIGACYSVISGVYFNKGQYQLSLENSIKAMGIAERHNDHRNMKDAIRNIYKNYLKMKDTTNTVRYLKRLMQLNRADNDKHGLISDLTNLGTLYTNKNDSLEVAKKMLDESWELSQDMKFPSGQVSALYGLGKYHAKKDNLFEAQTSFKKSMALADSLEQIGNVVNNQLELAKIAIRENDMNNAASWANQALSLSKEKDFLEQQAQAYQLLSEIAMQQNRQSIALSYFKQYKMLND
ncbi:MAG: hypothetical protein VX772_07680, partial [Bacteroidota bacterium]|nr:hypothetical protein [Bacteroidota bacterium]